MHTAAAYSVVQQRYLLDSGLLRPGVPHNEVVLGVTRLLAYSFAYQPLWLLLFAWADDVPWFGFSIAGGGDKSWAANTARALECSFAGGCEAALPNFANPVPVPLFAFIYVVGYVMYYGGLGKFLAVRRGIPTRAQALHRDQATLYCRPPSTAALSLESATFALLVNVAGSGLMSLYFLLPGTNPAPGTTPAWSVLVSLLLCCAGVAAFKRWEMGTPVHEQVRHAMGARESPQTHMDSVAPLQFGFGRLPPKDSGAAAGAASLPSGDAPGSFMLAADGDAPDEGEQGRLLSATLASDSAKATYPGTPVRSAAADPTAPAGSEWRRLAAARLTSVVSAAVGSPEPEPGTPSERLLESE